MSKLIVNLLCAVLLATGTGLVNAEEAKPTTLLYISPNDYNYSVHLISPYEGYWVEQGPLIEPIALKALQAAYGDASLCTGNETANRIIRIKPNVFYNSQVHLYYSKLVATVFSGKGNVVGTYVGHAKQLGFSNFGEGTKYHLNQVYSLAMEDLMTKLNASSIPESTVSENNLPCGLIGGQNDPKVSFY